MPKYTVEPVYRFGKQIEGEWRLLKGGHITSVRGFDACQLEEIAASLNSLTEEQRAKAKETAYRRTVLGEAA